MMGTMNTTGRSSLRTTTLDAGDTASIEQLTLLPDTSTSARFLLSKETRERGMRHVAEIRQLLAANADDATINLTPRHHRAA
jgi:hypothetical protein